MKKIIVVFLAAVVLSNCEVRPRQVSAQEGVLKQLKDKRFTDYYGFYTQDIDGITYGVWYVKNFSSQTGYDVEVVNLSKEKLQVELLELQIAAEKFKRQ